MLNILITPLQLFVCLIVYSEYLKIDSFQCSPKLRTLRISAAFILQLGNKDKPAVPIFQAIYNKNIYLLPTSYR
jgi:hypothetical protein